jgi:hypothetical protein
MYNNLDPIGTVLRLYKIYWIPDDDIILKCLQKHEYLLSYVVPKIKKINSYIIMLNKIVDLPSSHWNHTEVSKTAKFHDLVKKVTSCTDLSLADFWNISCTTCTDYLSCIHYKFPLIKIPELLPNNKIPVSRKIASSCSEFNCKFEWQWFSNIDSDNKLVLSFEKCT